MIKAGLRMAVVLVALAMSTGLAEARQYAALVMDARTGKVLHARNADTRLHPASLTKMMTLYVVFDEIRNRRLSLNQLVTVSRNAAAEPPSKLGLREGQKIAVRYLIRAASVKSANDAATALAEAVSGSESEFAKRMNAYARAMGMTNTTFRNAHGLTQAGHLSTARDMALLGRRLVYDFPQYYNLFSRRSTDAGVRTVRNTNRRLLNAYKGADGIKTGYTRAAGFNLVSSAKRGNKRVIVSHFGGASSAARNSEVARLMDLGFSRMPSRARVAALPRLRSTGTPARSRVASAAPKIVTISKSKPAASLATTATVRAARPDVVAALDGSIRPRSRGVTGGPAARVAVAGAPVAIASARNAATLASGTLEARLDTVLRPRARPGTAQGFRVAALATEAGSASTFASRPAPAPQADAAPVAPVIEPVARTETIAARPTSTGGNAWGVQIGVHLDKGMAERQLLTTALQDVPQLAGGLRRIETARVAGATVHRAQFVGLSQSRAVEACAALRRLNTDCAPISPDT